MFVSVVVVVVFRVWWFVLFSEYSEDMVRIGVGDRLGPVDTQTDDPTLQMQINSEMEVVMERALRHHPRSTCELDLILNKTYPSLNRPRNPTPS